MTHLLGSEFCIESLKQDVKDVQETVVDVSLRVGRVPYQSWKFPTELAVDVDVHSLMADYNFTDIEEDNQVTHIMLYDLLIDRILFLMQCFTHFNELLLAIASPNETEKGLTCKKNSMSAGLTSKRCWSRITQIATLLQRFSIAMQKSMHSLGTKEKESNCIQLPPGDRAEEKCDSEEEEDDEEGIVDEQEEIQWSRNPPDLKSESCQTLDTCYSSCETCLRTQTCLHEVGKAIVDLCKSQGLPTALENYIGRLGDSLMSIAEITRWKSIQSKDLFRIDRHLQNLMKQVEPLKKQVADGLLRDEKHQHELNKVKVITEHKEREHQEEIRKREHALNEELRRAKIKISKLTNDATRLTNTNASMTTQISKLKDELQAKERSVIDAESELLISKERSMERDKYQQEAHDLRQQLLQVTQQLEQSEKKLKGIKAENQQEKMKTSALLNREQALKSKHGALVERLGDLSEECDKLRDEICIAEEERDEVRNKLERDLSLQQQTFSDQVEALQEENQKGATHVTELESKIEDLEKELMDAAERERLLVSFPDLVNNHNRPPVYESSDIVTEMKRQIEANRIRIQNLQQENQSLLQATDKLQTQPIESDHSDASPFAKPVQLYQPAASENSFRGSSIISSSRTSMTRTMTSRTNQQPLTPKRTNHGHHLGDALKSLSSNNTAKTTFCVGAGKRRVPTPSSSRPESATSSPNRKPWS